jgi:hypothetical protein
MKFIYKVIISVLISLASVFSISIEMSPKGSIARLITYETGDVFVSLSQNTVSCSWGFYLDIASTPGYESLLSTLLSAYHTQATVYIRADENNLWSGSSNPTCKIYSIEFN